MLLNHLCCKNITPSFYQNAEFWDVIKKHCEASLYSQNISTRASGLDGLLYLLQKLVRNPDLARTGSLINLTLDYVVKWLKYKTIALVCIATFSLSNSCCLDILYSAENSGPTWYQSVIWSIAFYCGEHFAVLSYQHYAVVDFVVQCAIGWLVQNSHQPTEIQKEILQVFRLFTIYPSSFWFHNYVLVLGFRTAERSRSIDSELAVDS